MKSRVEANHPVTPYPFCPKAKLLRWIMSFLCKDQKDGQAIASVSALARWVIKCNRTNTFICLLKLKKKPNNLEKKLIFPSQNISFLPSQHTTGTVASVATSSKYCERCKPSVLGTAFTFTDLLKFCSTVCWHQLGYDGFSEQRPLLHCSLCCLIMPGRTSGTYLQTQKSAVGL